MAAYDGSTQLTKIFLGSTELNNVYDGERHLFSRPMLPNIRSFTVTPEHVPVGTSRSQGIVLAGLVDGARTFVVRRANGAIIARSGARWPISTPTADETFEFTAENVEGPTTRHVTFYRSVPMAISMTNAGSSQSGQPGGGVLITQTIRVTVTGHPGPVSLTWNAGETTTAAVQRRYDRATTRTATSRTFDIRLVRNVTGTSTTTRYSMSGKQPLYCGFGGHHSHMAIRN